MSISVVIPCFNHGRYIEEAVDSVFAQTVKDFEVVIVNDGSTDEETNRILEEFDRPDTRIVRIENRGLPGARNHGIRLTQKPFICALDADDVLEPTWFEKALDVFKAEPDVAFVSHWLRTFGDQVTEWTPERCDLASLLDMNTVNGAAMVRRQAIEDVGLFDETMRDGCEDWDLWLRMVERGYRGVIVPEFLFRYRRRPDSMSRLMNRPRTQLGLFRQLIGKHEASYRTHLLDLLQRRATNLCDLRGEMWDLEREWHEWWVPELARRREEAETLSRKVEELRERQRLEAGYAKIERRLADAEADLDGHRRALANASAEVEELNALQDASQRKCHELQSLVDAHAGKVSSLKADIGGHRRAIADAKSEIERLRALQDSNQQRCRELQSLVDRETGKVLSLRANLEGHETALADAGGRINDLQRAVRQRESELEAVHRSWSWRLMAPIRRLAKWLPGSSGDGR